MKKSLIFLGIVILLAGCTSRTFEKSSTSTRGIGFGDKSFQFTLESYTVDGEGNYYVMYSDAVSEEMFNEIIYSAPTVIEEIELGDKTVYVTYPPGVEEPTKDDAYSLIWYDNGKMYQIGNDAAAGKQDYSIMVDLFNYYNK
jgi:hypothetical protein